jgi:hypothetical protein
MTQHQILCQLRKIYKPHLQQCFDLGICLRHKLRNLLMSKQTLGLQHKKHKPRLAQRFEIGISLQHILRNWLLTL